MNWLPSVVVDSIARDLGRNIINDAFALIHKETEAWPSSPMERYSGKSVRDISKRSGCYNGYRNRHLCCERSAVRRGISRNVYCNIIAAAICHSAGIQLKRHLCGSARFHVAHKKILVLPLATVICSGSARLTATFSAPTVPPEASTSTVSAKSLPALMLPPP